MGLFSGLLRVGCLVALRLMNTVSPMQYTYAAPDPSYTIPSTLKRTYKLESHQPRTVHVGSCASKCSPAGPHCGHILKGDVRAARAYPRCVRCLLSYFVSANQGIHRHILCEISLPPVVELHDYHRVETSDCTASKRVYFLDGQYVALFLRLFASFDP